MSKSEQGRRLVALVVLIFVGWTAVMARLAWLHLGPNEETWAYLKRIRSSTRELVGTRGAILDRSGHVMAMDVPAKHICVSPKEIAANGQGRFIAYHLSRLLQIDPALVLRRVNAPATREQEYVGKFVMDDIAQKISRLGMGGVFMEDTLKRRYTEGALMSQVLGFANDERIGGGGVEARYNRYLEGVKGLRIGLKDGRQREIINLRMLDVDAKPGATVHLTLDHNLQYFVERALEAGIASNQAKAGWVIVEEVRTGRILAMASQPTFDPNQYGKSAPEARRNRTINSVYEPGSTFKVAVVAGGLNEGAVRPNTIVDCENGHWPYMGKILHDYHPYGLLSVADVIKKSSNIGAAKVALQLGPERLYRYLSAFGIGRKTGVDLPAEEGGILYPPRKWNKLSISRIPMGHEVAVTELQMINMLCAVGNDGVLMRPSVVARVVDADGHTVYEHEPEQLGRPIRPDTARLMIKLLTRATEDGGTGSRSRIEGFTIAGKTGSAQKPTIGGYSDTAHYASFMGLLPAEDPEIAIMVVIDEPQPLHTGGLVAAPIFHDIADQAVRCLDIAPVPAEQRYSFGTKIPSIDS
jgi:cell division protein FtsI (penicillin-binding protein 3)